MVASQGDDMLPTLFLLNTQNRLAPLYQETRTLQKVLLMLPPARGFRVEMGSTKFIVFYA